MTVPFTILTGFLGAGKTTALNRLLRAPMGRKIAVLVNELGRVAIDTSLIVSKGGDVLELAGGCVCCKLGKDDLWDGVEDVIKRANPDYLVLETTGIAEPPSILKALDKNGSDIGVHRAGVICVADASAGDEHCFEREEAKIQMQSSDRILLSKMDVADSSSVLALHKIIDELNPKALRASFGGDDDAGFTSWMLEERLSSIAALPVRPHKHSQIEAVCVRSDAPYIPELLMAAMERFRPKLLRAKGFVLLASDSKNDDRGFVEYAGDKLSLTRMKFPDGVTTSDLVLIGEDLNETQIKSQLAACQSLRAD